MCWAIPLVAAGADGVLWWGPLGGVCWACCAPLAPLTIPTGMGWERWGCSKAHPCEHPARTSLGTVGVGLDVGQEGQQKLSHELGCQDWAGSMG